jgi:hypothetical protein
MTSFARSSPGGFRPFSGAATRSARWAAVWIPSGWPPLSWRSRRCWLRSKPLLRLIWS